MKKGISLIVLVITILVLAILAGAIIVSISNTNTISKANEAVSAADLANAKNLVLSYWADSAVQAADGKATLTEAQYQKYVDDEFGSGKFTVTVKTEGACPTVATAK